MEGNHEKKEEEHLLSVTTHTIIVGIFGVIIAFLVTLVTMYIITNVILKT